MGPRGVRCSDEHQDNFERVTPCRWHRFRASLTPRQTLASVRQGDDPRKGVRAILGALQRKVGCISRKVMDWQEKRNDQGKKKGGEAFQPPRPALSGRAILGKHAFEFFPAHAKAFQLSAERSFQRGEVFGRRCAGGFHARRKNCVRIGFEAVQQNRGFLARFRVRFHVASVLPAVVLKERQQCRQRLPLGKRHEVAGLGLATVGFAEGSDCFSGRGLCLNHGLLLGSHMRLELQQDRASLRTIAEVVACPADEKE